MQRSGKEFDIFETIDYSEEYGRLNNIKILSTPTLFFIIALIIVGTILYFISIQYNFDIVENIETISAVAEAGGFSALFIVESNTLYQEKLMKYLEMPLLVISNIEGENDEINLTVRNIHFGDAKNAWGTIHGTKTLVWKDNQNNKTNVDLSPYSVKILIVPQREITTEGVNNFVITLGSDRAVPLRYNLSVSKYEGDGTVRRLSLSLMSIKFPQFLTREIRAYLKNEMSIRISLKFPIETA